MFVVDPQEHSFMKNTTAPFPELSGELALASRALQQPQAELLLYGHVADRAKKEPEAFRRAVSYAQSGKSDVLKSAPGRFVVKIYLAVFNKEDWNPTGKFVLECF
jgi:hypothetical protein